MGAKPPTRRMCARVVRRPAPVWPLTIGSPQDETVRAAAESEPKAAQMAAVTYELVRECLNNAEDAGGRWQIEGGRVLQGKDRKHVANYSSVKRVSCGTHVQNTAQLWLTSSS